MYDYITLRYITLYCVALRYIILYYIILYYIILYENEHIFKCIFVGSLYNILEFAYMENINFIIDFLKN